jgi:hypothetical protein
VPVSDHLVSISVGLVAEPALCPGAGDAERSQVKMPNLRFLMVHSDLDVRIRAINSIFFDPEHILTDPFWVK